MTKLYKEPFKKCDGAFTFGIISSTQTEHFSFSSQPELITIKRSHNPHLADGSDSVATWMRGVCLHFPCHFLGKPALMSIHQERPRVLSLWSQAWLLTSICSLNNNNKTLVAGSRDLVKSKTVSQLPCSLSVATPLFFFWSLSLSSGFSTQKAKGSEVTITLLHFTWPTQSKAISRQMRKTQTLWNATGPLI